MSLSLSTKYLEGFIAPHELDRVREQVCAAHKLLHHAELGAEPGAGSDFLGWLDLPENFDRDEFERVKLAAKKISANSDVVIVIGIGGSYLGARAAIEFVRSPFYNNLRKDTPDLYFSGNNISADYINEILSICEGRDVSLIVISKSGTTPEPALAFRIFREMLTRKYGRGGLRDRIFCVTDKARGTLKQLADAEGYESFVIPDNVGGRFSVLTPVGLLPIAIAGIDIDAMMRGAADARKKYAVCDLEANDSYRYAALRNCLYRRGKSVEMLVCYDAAFTQMAEWFKQLFGESEGKDGKGIFPASAIFSTDLHSMGQFIQDGSRCLFETVVNIERPNRDLFIGADAENADGLNFLSNQNISVVNRKAMEGTILAHTAGGVPNIMLTIPEKSAYEFGWMVYFFEAAVAISGYMSGVNPFDQPGVESYKKNMFALLGKPGYEELRASLEAKL